MGSNKQDIMRTVLAVAISAVLLLLWFFVLQPMFFPTSQTEDVNPDEAEIEEKDQNRNTISDDTEDNDLSTDVSDLPLTPVDIRKTDSIVEFETVNYIIYFNKKGGVFQDIRYKNFENSSAKDGLESAVFGESIKDYPQKYNEWLSQGLEWQLRPLTLNFTAGKDIYKEAQANYNFFKVNDDIVEFKADFKDKNGNIVEITKKYTFNNANTDSKSDYDFTLDITLRNKSDKDIFVENNSDNELSLFVNWGGGTGPYSQPSNYDKWVPYIAKNLGGDDIDVLSSLNAFKDKTDWNNQKIISEIIPSWIGMGNRYFLVSMMPEDTEYLDNIIYNFNEDNIKYQNGYFGYGYNFRLPAKDTKTFNIKIYCGPKRHSTLSQYGNKMKVTAEHGGFIEFLVRFVEWILLGVNSIIGNFAISIILVTILLRLVLFPLQAKSLKSMSRMKDLQPKMDELKQKFKDKPEKMNQAMMGLYKKEKINPLGGCLPMLLQLPFFIAFFNVMPYLVDLRGVSFLWINNLANPDTLFLLPFWPNQFNLLPLIMAGVMVGQTILQRQLQPAAATSATGGNQMKMLTFILPIVFLFITYSAPSGLTLYWTTSILFGIAQQMLFNYLRDKKKDNNDVEIIDSKGRKVRSKK